MDYFNNQSFTIGFIACIVSGGVFWLIQSYQLPIDMVILNSLFAVFGFISLLKGITETKKAPEEK